MEQADLAVLIGRFQPPHLSHQKLFLEALKLAKHLVVLTGSSNSARSIKNPFSFEERRAMILACVGDQASRVHVLPIRDTYYNDDLWVAQVQEKVAHLLAGLPKQTASPEVIMVGNFSDQSSYYLQLFPQWKKHPIQGVDDTHATQIRADLFNTDAAISKALRHLPKEIHSFLKEFHKSDLCESLGRELRYIRKYKESWNQTPFPVTFVTTDAVVTGAGHVLVIRRKIEPGKGLYALPGGFLRQDEFIEDGAIRELKEETGIRVDRVVLKACIHNRRVFDFPGRSLRGRTITHAFHIKLTHKELPEVRGGDDAEKAFWMPFADVYKMETEFFEDHAHIIQSFITQG